MSTLNADLYALNIPFKMTLSHSMASRSSCDSLVLRITDGVHSGFGETVLREYVNDLDGVFEDIGAIAERFGELIPMVTGKDGDSLNPERLREAVLAPGWTRQDLPLLTALEGAALDFLCRREEVDLYTLLGEPPLREELRYGGVLPLLSEAALGKMLHAYKKMEIPYMRIKLSGEEGYNRKTLGAARKIFGDRFDIRVDVNCGWTVEEAIGSLGLLSEYGVVLVEEPLGPDEKGMQALKDSSGDFPVVYVADESAVTFSDVDAIGVNRTFGMLNLRLAKNGGLLRVLELSKRADHNGLRYQLGCHVGETGILSMAGRAAAALMGNPEYVDGSFDGFLLSDNITTGDYTFGLRGKAPVLRERNMGYDVDLKKLEKYSTRIVKLMQKF